MTTTLHGVRQKQVWTNVIKLCNLEKEDFFKRLLMLLYFHDFKLMNFNVWTQPIATENGYIQPWKTKSKFQSKLRTEISCLVMVFVAQVPSL